MSIAKLHKSRTFPHKRVDNIVAVFSKKKKKFFFKFLKFVMLWSISELVDLVHGLNSLSKNILKLPLEKNNWNQGCWKSDLSLFCSIIQFLSYVCVLNNPFLFFIFSARSPVFSAMFEHEMEESKKVSRVFFFFFWLPPFFLQFSLIKLQKQWDNSRPFRLSQSKSSSHLLHSCCFSC